MYFDVIADWPVNRVGALLPWRVTLPDQLHFVNTVLTARLPFSAAYVDVIHKRFQLTPLWPVFLAGGSGDVFWLSCTTKQGYCPDSHISD